MFGIFIPVNHCIILINGNDVSNADSKTISKLVAFVPANFPHIDYMPVIDYIALGRSPYTNHFGRLSLEDLNVLEQTLELLGIKKLKHSFLDELSDGQRQLVSIAKALAQGTPIILLDEPMAFLDYSNRRALVEKLEQFAQKENKCVVFSSHDIDLSISETFEYLLIASTDHQIKLLKNPTKDDIVSTCFPH